MNAPDLVVAVQRNTKSILFNPFVVAMCPRLFGTGPKTNSIIAKGMTKEKDAFMADAHDEMYAVLAPGTTLQQMTRVTLELLASFFDDDLAAAGETCIDLFAWIRHVFTVSSTEPVYGPKNPFRHHPELEEAFWTFEKNMTSLLVGIFPSLTARAGLKARRQMTDALESYLHMNGGHAGGELLKVRYNVGTNYGIPVRDVATFEIGDCIGMLINATPTFFWLLFDLYSRPALLQALRQELESSGTLTYDSSDNIKSMMTLTIPSLRTGCPLLFSTFQEVLRIRTRNATSRSVIEDTRIKDSSGNAYLLKKDSIVQMPAVPMHFNTNLWGPDAKDFNPARFIKGSSPLSSSSSSSSIASTTTTSSCSSPAPDETLFSGYNPHTLSMNSRPASMRKVKNGAFRAFGGGATLCPGRHFATDELVAATAMFMSRFELEPVSGTGGVDGGQTAAGWKEPKPEGNRLASSIPQPSTDIKVKVRAREGYQGWGMRLDFGQGGARAGGSQEENGGKKQAFNLAV